MRTQVSLEGEKTRKEMKTIVTSLDDQAGLSTALKERVERVRHCACRCARMHARTRTYTRSDARRAPLCTHMRVGRDTQCYVLTYAVARSCGVRTG